MQIEPWQEENIAFMNKIEDKTLILIKVIYYENFAIDSYEGIGLGYSGENVDLFLEGVDWTPYEGLYFDIGEYANDHKSTVARILDFSYDLQLEALEHALLKQYEVAEAEERFLEWKNKKRTPSDSL